MGRDITVVYSGENSKHFSNPGLCNFFRS